MEFGSLIGGRSKMTDVELVKAYCSIDGFNVGVTAIGDDCPNHAGTPTTAPQ